MLKGTIINDIEDSNEILMLNKKIEREEIKTRPNHREKEDIPFRMNQPILKSEGIDYDKEINEAFNNFLNFNNVKFLENFNRLETNKNSKTNKIEELKIEDEIIIEDKYILLHDEEKENEKEDFESYKTKDDYYNKSSDIKKRKLEVEEGMEIMNNQMKGELSNLKKFDEFEKSINNFKVRIGTENIYDVELETSQNKIETKREKKREKNKMLVLSLCSKCLGGKLNENSIIASSENIYVAYPYLSGSITDFHFVIAPKEHINSLAAVDENVYDEVRNFMKSIVSFNLQNDMATIFLEFSQEYSQMNHFEIDCIPIKYKLLEDARMYFKKAIVDQDDEWTTNKKIVDTIPYKGNLTKILNEKFAYVNVDFNAQGGYLHPIENKKKYSQTFLREILCPLIKKEIQEIKYPKKVGVKELIDIVEEYKKKFDYFDWTKY